MIPKYFILFDPIVNGIVFLVSFLNCLLLFYKSTVVFVYWSSVLLKFKLKVNLSFTFLLSAFQVLHSHMCLVTAILKYTD